MYRRLDNRFEQPDNSEFAWELHRRRRGRSKTRSVSDSGFQVLAWDGTCDEKETHELVELAVVVGAAAVKYVIVPGAVLLAEKLIDVGVEKSLSEMVKAIFSRLRPKQEAKEILDFHITLPDGTYIDVRAPEQESTISITTPGGQVEISYARNRRPRQALCALPHRGKSSGAVEPCRAVAIDDLQQHRLRVLLFDRSRSGAGRDRPPAYPRCSSKAPVIRAAAQTPASK